jgi:DNA-binding NarL/FixJ family response regulator
MSAGPRVIVAEQDPSVRAAVRALLEGDGFTVCAEASDATNTIAAALRERPDLCLIAVMLPGGGIRAAAEIVSMVPGTAVVMLTESPDRRHLLDSVRAGAIAYLLNDTNPERIPATLRGVPHGEAAIPRALTAWLVSEYQARKRRGAVVGKAGAAELTDREWEVVELMLDDVSTGYIAERLLVSPVTVRRHISSALRKLGVSTREEARALLNDPARESRAAPGRPERSLPA